MLVESRAAPPGLDLSTSPPAPLGASARQGRLARRPSLHRFFLSSSNWKIYIPRGSDESPPRNSAASYVAARKGTSRSWHATCALAAASQSAGSLGNKRPTIKSTTKISSSSVSLVPAGCDGFYVATAPQPDPGRSPEVLVMDLSDSDSYAVNICT